MRQRLGLAAALLGSPELLVLDEPTDGIDPLGRMEVRRLLAEERARGATLFLNSHLLSETERVCDRVGILHEGRVVREGTLDELTRSETRWRVRLAGAADAAALRAAGLVEVAGPGLWRCEAADAAALNAVLDRCRAAGALVVELLREEKELEDVLAEAVRATGGSPTGRRDRPPRGSER
jgi:ABC-2 type transport system ATP-binding protein